ncbi:Oidioi.mRNA.OKI2018_I69.chr1.g1139.t1.cds [Oikopleura dioica]|uniref:Oidioi.mRNA.OKI2018_I69.chr1.g1139.t1.cds n=1 Tax=Oikopleura dioica TaxID=34765 RepID=A0ABN7SS75_OIKDI|nr:Oidioi.mRNA.OKI2018_I69.chr1.g1139.t1.cds [Oikopleura dioica]
MIFLVFFSFVLCADDDISLTDDVGKAYQSMSEIPDPIELTEITGNIPEWLEGSIYRNGPGRYEYGNDTFKHLFDPSAMIQKLKFENGSVFYQRRLINSTHTMRNLEEERIVLTEMGTWTEPENFGEIHAEDISMERCRHLYESFPTDNTVVSVYPIHGWIVAFTESPIITLNDPETLETKHILDIRKASSYPEGLSLSTVLAHGVIDSNGDFWTFATGIMLPKFGFIPKVVYLALKISASAKSEKSTPEEFLASISFSGYIFNEDERDLNMRYFHSFVQASDDFLVLPFTSLELQPSALLESCRNGNPPIEMMSFNKYNKGLYRIFDKKQMKWYPKIFKSKETLQMHPIQGFVDEESNEIVLDTLEIPNRQLIDDLFLENLNKTGADLFDAYWSIIPVGVPVRYRMNMDNLNSMMEEEINEEKLFDDDLETFQAYTLGGTDFPAVDLTKINEEQDDFWSQGIGNLVADRIYHSKISTGERWVWRESGFSPSEPLFIRKPESNNPLDGVVISIVSPLEIDSRERAFVVILEPEDLKEIARIYFKEDVDIALSFHGVFVPSKN